MYGYGPMAIQQRVNDEISSARSNMSPTNYSRSNMTPTNYSDGERSITSSNVTPRNYSDFFHGYEF